MAKVRSFFVLAVCLAAMVCSPAGIAFAYPSPAPAQTRLLPKPPQPTSGEIGQANQLQFEHLSLENGLSQSSVNFILQDSLGFMWFGTQDGLNKFDGYSFTIFRPIAGDRDSPSGQYFVRAVEGPGGELWLGTDHAGLERLDRQTLRFRHYRNQPAQSGSLSHDDILSLYVDRAGTLWVGTAVGLDRYDPAGDSFTHYRHDPADPASLPAGEIRAIFEDSRGAFWLGTEAGLARLDRASGKTTVYSYAIHDGNSLTSNSVTTIYEDRAGILWIGTRRGLNSFDVQSGLFTRYLNSLQDPYSLGNNNVTAILEDSRKNLWIATSGGGLDLLERETGKFLHIRHIPGEPDSLSSDFINSLYEDRSGALWIGTNGNGLSRLDLTAPQFSAFEVRSSQARDGLSNGLVWAIYQDAQGNLWFGTDNGLDRYDRQRDAWTYYYHDPLDPTTLSADVVHAIQGDRQGNIWVGTRNGLSIFDPRSGRFKGYTRTEQGDGNISSNTILRIYPDREGEMWLAYASGGLDRYDRAADKFIHIQPAGLPFSLRDYTVWTVLQDSRGYYWIGTGGAGLLRWDARTNQAVQYAPDASNPNSLSSSTVLAIHEDAKGDLWLGTGGGGLCRFDVARESFERFGAELGLPNDVVYGVLDDERGLLWLSTNNGLSRFDPATRSFLNFDVSDGLQSAEFNSGAYFQNDAGEIFFGGIDGVNYFNPLDMGRRNEVLPPVVLTSITQGGIPLKLDRSVETVREITLTWPYNFFEFEMAALSYVQPAQNLYAYKLENFDREWTRLGARRYGRYTNLSGGEYTLRLQAANSHGVWNETGASIHVRVVPPFWQTLWFRAALVLGLALAIVAGYRLRVREVEHRARQLETVVSQRTIELRQEIEQRAQTEEALRKSELEKAVLAERSRLARELHDAVTQTLFSASLIAEALPTAWENDVSEGRQLLGELRQLSRGALAEMRTLLMELRPSVLAEAHLEDLLRQLAEAVIGREGIPVSLAVEGKGSLPCDVHIALYRIAQEALNNVVKHARATQVAIHLRYFAPAAEHNGEGHEGVLLTVHDNGRGFDPDVIPPNHLGLGIMRERAQAIGAALTIESQPGFGSQIAVLWEREPEDDELEENMLDGGIHEDVQ